MYVRLQTPKTDLSCGAEIDVYFKWKVEMDLSFIEWIDLQNKDYCVL